MQKNTHDIVIFFFVVSVLLIALSAFIVVMVYLYRKNQISYYQKIERIKAHYERNLLSAQLEMQENTFKHISREIHDNINLSLTLAKLQLNTIGIVSKDTEKKIQTSVELLSKSISDLSDISQGLNSDTIIQQGLIKALQEELLRIGRAGLFKIDNNLSGEPVYLNAQQEVIIFRIVQEAFQNIIKHAEARHAQLKLHYDNEKLYIAINDDGTGFDVEAARKKLKAGLKNMEARVAMLQGTMRIQTLPGYGTALSFTIPFN